jgi:hypothetical protein
MAILGNAFSQSSQIKIAKQYKRLDSYLGSFFPNLLHVTLTILREDKNTTTTNLLTPVDNLRLAQGRDRKDRDHGRCKEICPVKQEPQYTFVIFSREMRGLGSGYAQVAVPVKVPVATLGCSVTS